MQKGLTSLTLAFVLASSAAAFALDEPDKAYLRRFTINDNFTAIIEYVDKTGKAIESQRTFSSPTPFKAGAGPTVALQGITINLFGLSACKSPDPIQVYIYDGPCNEAVTQYANTELSLSPILICRAYAKYAKEPVQDATCWNLYAVADISIVHSFEGALLRTGAATLTRDDKGQPLRPDLVEDEDYAKGKQTLLWNPAAAAVTGLTP